MNEGGASIRHLNRAVVAGMPDDPQRIHIDRPSATVRRTCCLARADEVIE